MNQFLIYIISALGMLLCAFSIENKRIPLNRVSAAVYCSYQNLLSSTGRTGVILMKIALLSSLVLLAVFSYCKSASLIGTASIYKTIILMITILVILGIALFYLFGLPLLIFSKIENLIKTEHKRKLSFRFLITSYILYAYSFLLWYAPEAMVSCGQIILVGLLISYAMNMAMLINISVEPLACCCCRYGVENRIEQKHPMKIVLAGAMVLILLIVLDLYLGVIMIANLYEPAYYIAGTTESATYLDLLYYTVISFTTTGYGDIIPQQAESKVMGIVIAFTSVMCLVIFISSILALKEKLNG